jgi:CheY-like chemotaxis protein
VVEISLGLDPSFEVRSCASGGEALSVATEWAPHVILCDVVMPVMGGPETLARLRENPETAKTTVIFLTARAQRQEVEHFKALGAAGVICKPFDPMTLASEVRRQIRTGAVAALCSNFSKRLRSDGSVLAKLRLKSADCLKDPAAIEEIKTIAHALSGAAGIFGCDRVGDEAAMLARTCAKRLRGEDKPGELETGLDSLLACIKEQSAGLLDGEIGSGDALGSGMLNWSNGLQLSNSSSQAAGK